MKFVFKMPSDADDGMMTEVTLDTESKGYHVRFWSKERSESMDLNLDFDDVNHPEVARLMEKLGLDLKDDWCVQVWPVT